MLQFAQPLGRLLPNAFPKLVALVEQPCVTRVHLQGPVVSGAGTLKDGAFEVGLWPHGAEHIQAEWSIDQKGVHLSSADISHLGGKVSVTGLMEYPDFKTFEILSCDKPTGSWASGVQWVFFNGEGLWLEGPAADWFAPATLAAIRKCHAILREHRDAFTSAAPVPLVPTEAGGVFANLFPADGKRVFTFYNSRHRTFSGEVLRLPHAAGARYHDAWNERDIQPRRDGPDDVLATTLEPLGVGCLVVTCTQ